MRGQGGSWLLCVPLFRWVMEAGGVGWAQERQVLVSSRLCCELVGQLLLSEVGSGLLLVL